MRLKDILPAALVALAMLGMALTAAADKAGPAPDAKAIAKLVEQLGSDSFEDREAATKALDAIGAPALEALEKAAKSEDAEIRKRAGDLASRIGTRARTGVILTPREVHLVYKGTPLREAIADFEKKAGVGFNLLDAAGKMKEKKVTLDTGKVPFWTALEKFCEAAGLDEADPNKVPAIPFPMGKPGFDGPPAVGFGGGPAFGGVVRPGGGVKRLTPEQIKKIKDAAEAAEAEKRKAIEAEKKKRDEAEKKEREEAIKKGLPGAAAAKPAIAVDLPAVAAEKPAEDKPVEGKPLLAKPLPAILIKPMPPVAALPPVAVPVFPPMAGGGFPGGMPMFNPFVHGKINLVPGKAAKTPTDKTTSVRVRVAPPGVENPFGRADEKVAIVMLQAAPEPRLRWQQLLGITVDKALDDKDQKLMKFEPPMPEGGVGGGAVIGGGVVIFPGGGFGKPGFPGMFPGGGLHSWSNDGINHNIMLMLKKGEKASKKLKELTGSISARFLGEAKPLIVADDLMKAAGKTFKGVKDGSITIKSAKKADDGTVTIVFEFEQPADVTPETQIDVPAGFVPGGGMPGGGPMIFPEGPMILPALPALPPAGIKPAIRRVLPKKAEDKPAVKEEAAKPAVKAEVAVEVAVGKPGVAGGPGVPGLPGVAIAMPAIALPPMVGGGFGGIGMGPDGKMMMFAQQGLTLQDDKGNVLSVQIQIDWRGARIGGAIGAKPKMDYVAVYKAQKGQPAVPAKLVFTGRTAIDVNIPFKLENVDVK